MNDWDIKKESPELIRIVYKKRDSRINLLDVFHTLIKQELFLDVVLGWWEILIFVEPSEPIFFDNTWLLPQKNTQTRELFEIPVLLDGEDLRGVLEQTKLSLNTFKERLFLKTYFVAMIGFIPGFPYLDGLHPTLNCPRRNKPRTKVKAGSLAIGGAQIGIYPIETPGGWNLIGEIDPLKLGSLKPGDRILFNEVENANKL